MENLGLVGRRLRDLSLSDVVKLERAAQDKELPGISRTLTAAITRAESYVGPVTREAAAREVAVGLDHIAGEWPGAVTIAYGARLASSCWSRLEPDDLKELACRFDKLTGTQIQKSGARLQLRELARSFAGVA